MTQVERTTVREEVERVEETETFRQCDGCSVDDSEADLRTLHVTPRPTSAISDSALSDLATRLEHSRPGPPPMKVLPKQFGSHGADRADRRERTRKRINEELRDSIQFTSDGEIDLCPDCAYTFFDYEYEGDGDHPDDRDVDDEDLRVDWADADGLTVRTTIEKHSLVHFDNTLYGATVLVGYGFLLGAALATEITIPMAGLWALAAALAAALVAGAWGPRLRRAVSRRGEA